MSKKPEDHDTKKLILFPPGEEPQEPEEEVEEKRGILLTASFPKVSEDTVPIHATKSMPPVISMDGATPHNGKKLPEKIKGMGRELGHRADEYAKELGQKADQYANQMFVEDETTDYDEIDRLERLVPGTDEEEGGRRYAPARENRKKAPPDISPRALASEYLKGLKMLIVRKRLVFLLAFITTAITTLSLGEGFPLLLDQRIRLVVIFIVYILGVILSIDQLAEAVMRCCDKKFGLDSLCVLLVATTIADCAYIMQSQSERMPYCAVVLFTLGFLLYSAEQKKWAHRQACRIAAVAEEPYLVRSEPFKWNGKDAYTKQSGPTKGFGSQMQQDDGAQRFFSYVAPIFLVGTLLFLGIVSDNVGDFIWGASALLCGLVPFGGLFAYSRIAHKISRKLAKTHSALAGWPTTPFRNKNQVIVTDSDLFPQGSVTIAHTSIVPEFHERRVIAYTASMLREAGIGTMRAFEELMIQKHATFFRVEEFLHHESGGLTGRLGNDVVYVGNASFLELMKIIVPAGHYMDQLLFIAINGRLAGTFTMDYRLNDVIFDSINTLIMEKISPVLATRDFPLTPEVLKNKFRLRSDRMDFPSIKRRRELSEEEDNRGTDLTAVVCREGLAPFAECIIAAKRLRKFTHLAITISLISMVFSFILFGYLIGEQAYTALSVENMLIYQFIWLFPVWFTTDLGQRGAL
ncbi:MAG: hypothetical protein R3Y07_00575 [Eubacteriales bacterium]